MYSKLSATVFSIGLMFLLILPIKENFKKKPKDNFPFSYYPMFAIKRDSLYDVNYFVGYDNNGGRHYIPHDYIGTGGFNQVRRQLNKKCKKGETDKVTNRVAEKIAKTKSEPYTDIKRIELVTGTFHLENYFFAGETAPRKEKVLNTREIVQK